MKFGDKLRMARKVKKLTQAVLAEQAGLSLRTIIAYEKGETYPQKRSTYQVLAGLLDVPLDYLRNEESEPDLQQPLPKEVWEAKVQQLAHDLGLVPRLTYEEYCEGFRKHAEAYEPESGRVMEVWSDLPGVPFSTTTEYRFSVK